MRYLLTFFVAMLSISAHGSSTIETWNFTSHSSQTSAGFNLTSNLGSHAAISAWSSQGLNGNVTAGNITLNSYGTNVNGHGVDSNSGSEFILLEFDRPVQLESLLTRWNEWNNTAGSAWLSVAGFDSNPFAGNQNWASIAALTTVKSAYQNNQVVSGASNNYAAVRQTSFADVNHVALGNNGNSTIAGIAKNTWLIGAYNYYFNQTSTQNYAGDIFKFSSLTTSFNTPQVDVPAPATLALFGLGFISILVQRKKLQRKKLPEFA